MTANTKPTEEYLNGLITELCKLPEETGWVEFKDWKGGQLINYRIPFS